MVKIIKKKFFSTLQVYFYKFLLLQHLNIVSKRILCVDVKYIGLQIRESHNLETKHEMDLRARPLKPIADDIFLAPKWRACLFYRLKKSEKKKGKTDISEIRLKTNMKISRTQLLILREEKAT